MDGALRKFFTRLAIRKQLSESEVVEIEAITAHSDWEKRFLLYLLVTESSVMQETLGYEPPEEK